MWIHKHGAEDNRGVAQGAARKAGLLIPIARQVAKQQPRNFTDLGKLCQEEWTKMPPETLLALNGYSLAAVGFSSK